VKNKKTLTFLHGWGVNQAVWHPIAEQLSTEYDTRTLDLPGFGSDVEHTLTDYSFSHIVDEIAKQLEQPTLLIGWSLGGLIATGVALNYPEKVSALITVASSPCFVEKEGWPGINAQVLAGFHQQLSGNIEKTINNFLKIQAMGSPHLKDDVRKLRNLVMEYPIPSQQTLDDSLKLLETVDLRNELNKLTMPFYRIYGRLDSLVPRAVITEVDQLLTNNKDKHVFDKESHAPFISDQQTFIAVLQAWLADK